MHKQFDITRIKMKQIENARKMVRKRFPELIEGYISDAQKYLSAITKGLEENDMESVVKNSHALKSSSASLGITGAFEVARELEKIAKEPELQNADELLYLNDLLNEALDFAKPLLFGLLKDVA